MAALAPPARTCYIRIDAISSIFIPAIFSIKSGIEFGRRQFL